jgi:hypothetical protein
MTRIRERAGWVLALVALLALVLALGMQARSRTAGAAGPPTPDPYATPEINPQEPKPRAQSVPAGAVFFPNGTNVSPPICIKALVPRVNPQTRVILCANVVRPPEGGSLHLLELYTADGVQATIDLTALAGYEDCFGASPQLSDFSGTIKAMVSCKDNASANGNDRVVFPVDTGLAAIP